MSSGSSSSSAANPPPVSDWKSWFSQTPRLVLLLGAVVIMGMVWLLNSSRESPQLGVDEARSTLAVMFSVATIILAFCMILSAFLSESSQGSDGLKERFAMALQVLTPLLGIMGTILGFYFGTTDRTQPIQPLAIVDVVGPTGTVSSGQSHPITLLTQGGQGAWTYELDIGGVLPTIQRTSSQPFLRETLKFPEVQEQTAVGIKISVTDAVGNKVHWERKAKEWVTLE